MKSQIFFSISALASLIYVNERIPTELPPLEPLKVEVLSSRELIEQTELKIKADSIEEQQLKVSKIIKETVKDKIVDSIVVPRDTTENEEANK